MQRYAKYLQKIRSTSEHMHGVHKSKILRFVLVIGIKPSQKLFLVGVHVPYYAFVSLHDKKMVIDEPGALTHIMVYARYTNTICWVVKAS